MTPSQTIRIFIATPAKQGSNKGNRITAQRWATILRSLGHRVRVGERYSEGSYDLLIALHARKSASSVSRFRRQVPGGRVIVVLTGTDLHRDFGHSKLVVRSLQLADRIVVLEPQGALKLPQQFKKKIQVIFQSAERLVRPPKKLTRFFEVSVLGHLRPVKDPFRTAYAARRLPPSSRVRVVHFGRALTARMESTARREMGSNFRYRWFGSVPHGVAQRRLARSRLTVLSSKSEGGPAVLSEAIVNDVPILASRIDASVGILGANHPGLFEYGDTQRLAELMNQAETEPSFFQRLVNAGRKLKPEFAPRREKNAWRSLLSGLFDG